MSSYNYKGFEIHRDMQEMDHWNITHLSEIGHPCDGAETLADAKAMIDSWLDDDDDDAFSDGRDDTTWADFQTSEFDY